METNKVIARLLSPPIQAWFGRALLFCPLRKRILAWLESMIWNDYMIKNPYRRPKKAQEDKFCLSKAMLHSLDRGLSRGWISRAVWLRLLRSFSTIHCADTERRETFFREFGAEPPAFVAISPTGFCNLMCQGCYANSSPQAKLMLPYSTVDRIIQEQQSLWGSHFTVISGGEPFFWQSEGKGILDLIGSHPDHFFLAYTNGTAITESVAKRLADLGNLTPAVSVEGFREETDARRGAGVYDRILKALEHLRKFGVPFGISATATAENAGLLMSREFLDFYFEEQGALYGWIFQYMPIGREFQLERMLSPERRFQMMKQTWRYIYEDGYFLADFWNCGTFSDGCISAGRHGGYFYVDWNGNVMPCVFNPYYVQNIHQVYAEGGDLNTLLHSPFFSRIREWIEAYAYDPPASEMENVLAPCAIRDHYQMMHDLVEEMGARPADECAKEALASPSYHRGLIEYDREFEEVTRETWERQYLAPERGDKEKEVAERGAQALSPSSSPPEPLLSLRD
jgi:MoaA/NifB/PqqE/SkfB family radical SAM enzyme